MQVKSTRYKQGSIERRENAKSSVWRYRYNDADGKPKVLTFDVAQYPTEATVLKATERLRHEINTGTSYSHVKKLTISIAVDLYLDSIDAGLKPRTRDTYRNHGNHIQRGYGDMPVDEINGLQVQAWLTSLPMAGSQKANVRTLFKNVVRYAMLSGRTSLQFNPIELIRLKGTTKRNKEIIILTPDEFVRLVKAVKKPHDRALILCAFLGLRIGECLALRWDDFNEKTSTVKILRSISSGFLTDVKTDASRAELPMPKTLMEHVQSWKDEAVKAAESKNQPISPWLFPSQRAKSGIQGYSGILMQKRVHPACDAIGIPRIGFHALRHSYRSWLDSKGVSAGTSKDMMRHADIATTMNIYGRTMPAEMKIAAESIAGLLVATNKPLNRVTGKTPKITKAK